MQKLARVMTDSRLLQEENLTNRKIIAALGASPAGARTAAAFIHSRAGAEQQLLQRRPSSASILPSTAAAVAAAAAAARASVNSSRQIEQQVPHLAGRMSRSSVGWNATLELEQQQQQLQSQCDLQHAPAADLLPIPTQLQLACPDISQHKSQQQQQAWQPGDPGASIGMPQIAAAAAPIAGIAGPGGSIGVGTHIHGRSRAAARRTLSLANPEPTLPAVEKATAVLRSSEKAGWLNEADVTQITAALATEAAVRCSSRSSNRSSGNENSPAPGEPGSCTARQGSIDTVLPAGVAAAGVAGAGVSEALVEKIAAQALKQAKGEATSALLGLVAVGTGVSVEAVTNPLKRSNSDAATGGVVNSRGGTTAGLLQDGLEV